MLGAILTELFIKTLNLAAIVYTFNYLCTDYADAVIELVQSYIQVIDLLYTQQPQRRRFSDVHYYFSHPSSKPLHHRFDKGSYLYLYHNAIQRRGRLEIANNAGTPDQDAFDGYLDTATIRNTQKHPHLFTITVDTRHGSPMAPHAEHTKWHLPAYDPRNEQKYLYKIQTLDIYFWTNNDATLFLDSTQRALADQQLQYDNPPPQEHHDSMSPVVQQLEQAAIGGPYRQRTESTATTQSFPGPPTGPAPGQQQQQQQSAPAPYNPAAPAAPEPIAYREKTPPPVDGATGTGLTAAAMHEHPTQYASAPSHRVSYQQTPQQSYFPGPPQRTASGSFGTAPHTQGISSSFPPPPPGQSPQQHPSFSPPPSSQPQVPSQVPLPLSPPPTTTSFQQSLNSQPQTQYASFPSHQTTPYLQSSNPLQSPGLPPTPSHPPAYTTHTPLQSPGFAPSVQSPGLPPPPPGGPQHPQHAQSLGGYSNYSYGQQHQQPPSQQEAYSVHSQAYRPTEAEAAHGAKPPGTKPVQGQGQGQGQGGQGPKPGGLEERLGKVEKGVGRFLKKFDQKW